MVNKKSKILINCVLLIFLLFNVLLAGDRTGTTTANFLEIGYGSAGNSMGDAYTSVARDLSSVYWNPAGLGFMEKNEFLTYYQPWFADINSSLSAIGFVTPRFGTIALSVINISYGDEDVTTVKQQEGTGEKFNGQDIAVTLSMGRKITEWFTFGISGKYIQSRIWHETGKALAMDLGVMINTAFLSPDGSRKKGLTIGGCISNYGTKMRFDGIDLKQQVDVSVDEDGNYAYAPVRYELKSWEIPLIFRFGASIHPIWNGYNKLTLAADALHLNNNEECINVGAKYEITVPNFGVLSVRGGYKALFLKESEFGPSLGFGLKILLMNNRSIKIDYSYRDIGILGAAHGYSLGMTF